MPTPSLKRLSQALCEAVEFGRPLRIRMGERDYYALVDSVGANFKHDFNPKTFEGVDLQIEETMKGCVVEHDNRYLIRAPLNPSKAIPETVVFMRDTKKPAIVAW